MSDLRHNVLYITLGCAKNEVDTDRMRSLLNAADYDEVFTTDEADVVIINTCSFLASASEESIQTTLAVAEDLHDEGIRNVPIVMTGCLPSRYGTELFAEMPEVARFVCIEEEDNIVSILDEVLASERACPQVIPALKRTVEGSVAYVKISDGCDRYCHFCAIPYIRGRYYSRSCEEILSEVRGLVAGGVREIILIGQDTGIWGTDFDETVEGPRNLAQLMQAVAQEVRGKGVWVRVLYLQPEGMTEELIGTIRDTPEILPYIDIPIQHCNARVLKSMHRSGSTAEFEELFEHLRNEIPGMVIRSTAMAGYPGETDEEAEELVDFLERVGFDYCSVFAYSPEEGTVGATLPDQIDEDIKQERTQDLMDLAETMGFSATAAHVGEICDVIIDGIEETEDGSEFIGHAWFQAPDSDGAVHLDLEEAAIGDVVRVKLVDSFCYELVGEVIDTECE